MTTPTTHGTVPWPEDCRTLYTQKGLWEGKPLGEHFWERADRHPDKTALVASKMRLSYQQLMERADGAAGRLLDLGLQRDDRIVVQLPNCAELVICILACLRSGIVPVMALTAHRRHELVYLAELSEAKAVVVPGVFKDFDHQELGHEVVAAVPTVQHVLTLAESLSPGDVDLSSLCGPPDDQATARARLDAAAPDPGGVALFLLSGGTTGLPKLIARTHDDYAYNVKQSSRTCGFDEDTVYLATMPLGHNFTLACPGILGTLLNGGTVVVLSSPEPTRAFSVMDREGVTHTAAVPGVAQRWLDFYQENGSYDLSRLRVLQVGGARLSDEIAVKVRPVLGCTLQQVFGMAEGLINYTRLDDPDEVICNTQGRPMSEYDEVLVVDPVGIPVPDGQPGLLLTRGPYTPRGYYRAAEQNARAFTADGWYRTGDIVRRRGDGNLVVEGRDKDMINRGGEKISAEEIENLVYQLPSVSRVAAVAMPADDLGERLCIYVVPRSGSSVQLDDVHRLLEEIGVANFKFPDRLVTVGELAVTNVGKIDKKALRADIAARLEAEVSHGATQRGASVGPAT